MKLTISLLGNIFLSLIVFFSASHLHSQNLKSVIYDFEGFDLNSSSLPEGDYSYGDLNYSVAQNPLGSSAMLGNRILKMNLNWLNGYGAFGRGISRYIELDPTKDFINFYFYNPVSNNQSATFKLKIADDDNQSNSYESTQDDTWEKNLNVPAGNGWQLVSVPLADLTDSNPGGNGIFDISYTLNKGMLLLIEFRFNQAASFLPNPVFYIDMICISEGSLQTGTTITDLPPRLATDYCLLGAHRNELPGEYYKIPTHFEAMFPPAPVRKIKYAHTYLQWGINGTPVAQALPGQGIQTLINDGYTPILTWEPLFKGFGLLDPSQPKLIDIINGNYNAYLDAFGDQMKTYTDTVIVRLMHEFDGDWYPWSVSQNNNDPAQFALAFRTIVQRVKARGATKVKWMWCPNNQSSPVASFNWVVLAYPGNAFVDIVGTDVYNAHYPTPVPWWRSFRWQFTEIYYYLTKYFPGKPVFISELACRERLSGELSSSETKSQWIEQMDKELQSFFHKTRALIFFDEQKSFSWNVNSSTQALNSLNINIWNDDYYFEIPFATNFLENPHTNTIKIFPNPSNGKFRIISGKNKINQFTLINALGKKVFESNIKEDLGDLILPELGSGLYLLHYQTEEQNGVAKIIIEK